MKMIQLFPLVLCLVFSATVLQSQVIDTSNPSLAIKERNTKIDSSTISLEEYNRALADSGFETITEDDPLVTKDKQVWLYYEIPLPEESEEAVEVNVPVTTVIHSLAEDPMQSEELDMSSMLGTSITGISFDTDAATSGFYHIPPDPSGAVGTTHVCHVVNTSITCHTKAGIESAGFPKSLANFFTSLSPENASFDPKIIWDQYENRFVVITLIKTATSSGDAANISRLLLGVSDTADPTGSWTFQDIAIDQTISSNDCWFDYPGFAVDDKAIYITGSYFSFSDNASCQASFVLIVDKGTTGGIYDGTNFADEDPASNSAFSLIRPSVAAGNGFNSTLQPAHMHGTPPANMGTWLVSYSGLSNGTNEAFEFFKITDPVGTPTLTRQILFVGNIDNTASAMVDASQSGTATTIEVNDRRTLNAVWRNDKLWVTTQVIPNSGTNSGQTTALWTLFDADGTNNIALDKTGEIGGEDIAVGATTFFPSIAVNSAGNAGVSFSASHSSIFAGAYAIGINGTTGVMTATETVQAGTDDYVRTFGGSNRWGDYGRMALDPSDDGFWAINQAAISNGTLLSGENGRWQVFIEELAISLPVELSTFEVKAENKDAILTWSTASESDNLGFFIEQLIDDRFLSIDFVKGAGTSLEQHDYQYRVKNLNAGNHLFRLRQVDFNHQESLTEAKLVNIEGDLVNFVSSPAPNPFRDQTEFKVSVARNQRVMVRVVDLNGKVVQELAPITLSAKEDRQFNIDGSQLPDALYVLQVIGEDFSSFKKLILRKN